MHTCLVEKKRRSPLRACEAANKVMEQKRQRCDRANSPPHISKTKDRDSEQYIDILEDVQVWKILEDYPLVN
jgi:hypothetical protein